jgi:hypothetical protein
MAPRKGVWTTIKPIPKSAKKTSAAKTKTKAAAKKKKAPKTSRAPRSVGKSLVASALREMAAAGEI